jgi:hypothetical protein
MTAATLTNAQSALTVRFEQANEAVKANVEQVKQDALELRRVAVAESKQQANRAVISLTMMLPIFLVLGLVLAFHHVNVMAIARMLPMCGLGIALFAAMNFLNCGASRNESADQ